MDVIAALTQALADGSVEVVDLSRPVRSAPPAASWLATGLAAGAVVGEALVIDRRSECARDPDYHATVGDVLAFQAEHGVALDGSWLILQSGRGGRAGFDAACLRWLAHDTPVLGIGLETATPDVGEFVAAGKHALADLDNVEALSPTGSVLIAAQLRVLALVPRTAGT